MGQNEVPVNLCDEDAGRREGTSTRAFQRILSLLDVERYAPFADLLSGLSTLSVLLTRQAVAILHLAARLCSQITLSAATQGIRHTAGPSFARRAHFQHREPVLTIYVRYSPLEDPLYTPLSALGSFLLVRRLSSTLRVPRLYHSTFRCNSCVAHTPRHLLVLWPPCREYLRRGHKRSRCMFCTQCFGVGSSASRSQCRLCLPSASSSPSPPA